MVSDIDEYLHQSESPTWIGSRHPILSFILSNRGLWWDCAPWEQPVLEVMTLSHKIPWLPAPSWCLGPYMVTEMGMLCTLADWHQHGIGGFGLEVHSPNFFFKRRITNEIEPKMFSCRCMFHKPFERLLVSTLLSFLIQCGVCIMVMFDYWI